MSDLGFGAGGVAEAISSLGQIQQQQQSKQMFPLQMQEEQLKVSDDQLKLQSSRIALQKQQSELSMLNQMVATGKLGPGMTPQDQLTAMSEVALAGGNINEASLLLTRASTITKNQQEAADKKLAAETKVWTTVDRGLSQATDAAGYDRAKAVLILEHPEIASLPDVQKILQLPYSPQLVDALKKQSETKLQAAQESSAEQLAETRRQERKLIPAREAWLKAETDRANQQTKNLEKAGAKSMVPKLSDYEPILDEVVRKYGDPIDVYEKRDMRRRSRGAVEYMLELQRQGVPQSTAAVKAFEKFDKDGAYHGLQERGTMGRPSSSMHPRELPAGIDPKSFTYNPNTGELKVPHGQSQHFLEQFENNQWYTLGGQSVLFYKPTGTFFTKEDLKERREEEEHEDEEADRDADEEGSDVEDEE